MKKYRSLKAAENIIATYDKLVKHWNVDTEEFDVNTRYGRTHVIAAGNKLNPPVVLFHGVGDDSALMWLYNANKLSNHFRIYAIDTIGGPGKSIPSEGYNKEFDDVRWIDEIFAGLKLERAHIVGVSHGGYLAQLYTVKRPEKVDRAVAISSSVAAGDKKASPMKTMMKIFMPEALFPSKANVYKLLRKLSGRNYGAFTDNPLILEHYKWLLKGFNNMAMAYHKVENFSDDEIEKLRDRIVFLVGEEDPFQKLGGKALLMQKRMNAIYYEGAGHGLNHELADVINQKLIELLSGK